MADWRRRRRSLDGLPASRDRYKRLVEANDGTWRPVHLKVDPAVLRQRLIGRADCFDADAAFPITQHTFAAYLAGFAKNPRGTQGRHV